MNGSPVEHMSRHELEHEVKLLRMFTEKYASIIRQTCKKASAEEAYLWGNFIRFDNDYYLHPEPYMTVDKPN